MTPGPDPSTPSDFEDKTHLLVWLNPSAMWISGCLCFEGMAAFPCRRADRQLEDDTVGLTSAELALRSRVPGQAGTHMVSQSIPEVGLFECQCLVVVVWDRKQFLVGWPG